MELTVRKIELLGLVSMLGLGLNAATITVGKTGAAYTKIQDGINAAIAGDTVTVAAGVYNEKVDLNKGITLAGASGAIIDGSGFTPSGDDQLVSVSAGSSTLQGFEIRNFATSASGVTPAGIRIAANISHVTIQNNKVHDITTSEGGTSHAERTNYNAHGICLYGASGAANTDINILGNEVYNCKLGQSESVVVNGNVNGFVIANNYIHNTDNIGIDVIGWEGHGSSTNDFATNGKVYQNTVSIDDTNNYAYKSPGGADGIYVDGGTYIVIERNKVDRCPIGIETASEHSGHTTDHITIRDNFVSNSFDPNISVGGQSSSSGQASNIVIVNNTTVSGAGSEINFQYHATNVIIKNNIFYGPGGITQSGSSNTGVVIDTNIYGNGGSAPSAPATDAHPKVVDPKLDATYHLLAGSPAIDAGLALGNDASGNANLSGPLSGTLDIDGEARVQGSAIDIGADEYTGVQIVAVSLSPTSATLATGATQQFTATVTGSTNFAVTWTASGGTVSSSGLYSAPATAGTYSVTATSAADTSKSASATVIVTAAVVAVAISPTSTSLATGATQQFTATVTGSTNTAVTWTASGGTVSSAGLYTAPTTAGSYTVKATSVADSTKSASATVTVTAATIAVAISPTTATLATGATQQFTATVTGSSNTSVTWTTSGGTVSSAGLYTAPATAGSYTVRATSVADTSKSATASVTVTTGSTFTIGYTSTFTSSDSGNANYLKAMKVTLSKAASIQSLAMYVGTKGGQLTLGIYSDASGSPGTLVATTASFTPVAGWNTVATSTHPSLAAGSYWLVFETNSNTQAQRYQTGSVAIKSRAFTYATMPSSFGTASTDWLVNYSLYATLQ